MQASKIYADICRPARLLNHRPTRLTWIHLGKVGPRTRLVGSPDSRSRSLVVVSEADSSGYGGGGAAVVRSSVCVCVVSGLCGRSLP